MTWADSWNQSLIAILENHDATTITEFWDSIPSGTTSGTLSPRAGHEFVANQWEDGVDAIVTGITGGVPNLNPVYSVPDPETEEISLVTATLDTTTGAYALSGEPAGSDPVALVTAQAVSPVEIDWANPIAVTGATTLTIGKAHVLTGSTYTVNLPAVAGNAGKFIYVEMDAALTGLVTIDGDGAETVGEALTQICWAQEKLMLRGTGVKWVIAWQRRIPMTGTYTKTSPACTANAYTKVVLDTAEPDGSGGMWLVSGEVKAVRPGLIRANAYFIGNSTASRGWAYVYKNGAAVAGGPISANANVAYSETCTATLDVSVVVDDVIQVYVYMIVANSVHKAYLYVSEVIK